MVTLNSRFANLLPYAFLRGTACQIKLAQPAGVIVPASGVPGWILSNWKPGWLARLLKKLVPREPGLFVDVGANVGQTMLSYKFSGGIDYLGIEPNPTCVGFLDRVIEISGLSNYRVVPTGLSDENKFTRLYLHDSTDTAATMLKDLRLAVGKHEQIVSVVQLDSLLGDLSFGDVGIIKIDVEGYELEALRGMRRTLSKDAPIIVCEVLGTAIGKPLEPKKFRNAGIMQMLAELDYEVHSLRKNSDGNTISTELIQEFPDVYWSEEAREEFDYIFLPKCKAKRIKLIQSP